MSSIYQQLIANNKVWADRKRQEHPDFFGRSVKKQKPPVLWIGCSDSQMPTNEITGSSLGEMYVHRNLANMVIHSDLNFLTALDYSVNTLGVKHIIICGHYGCDGIKAGMEDKDYGLSENWIQYIKDVYQMHHQELSLITDSEVRFRRFVELNVIQQMIDLSKTTVFRRALREDKGIQLHSWVYNSHSGHVVELGSMFGTK